MAKLRSPAVTVKMAGSIIVVLLCGGALELSSYLFLSLDVDAIRHRVYWPPVVSASQFQSYLEQRDPLLGWPTQQFLQAYADADGARRSPANAKFGNEDICVSTYGDSFTFSSEVEDDSAWPNLLAEYLRCSVKNYGVPGYGVDQAVLRFQSNGKDNAHITILGFYVDDVGRNMNQWRYLINGDVPFSFKPSFTLGEDGRLNLQRIPVNSYEEFLQIVDKPEKMLTVERYLPDMPTFGAPVRPEFPYSWSLALFAKRKVIEELRWENMLRSMRRSDWNYPHWYATKDGAWPDTVALNTAIMRQFAQHCQDRNRRCVVLVIPDIEAIRSVQEGQLNELDQFLDPVALYVELWKTVDFFAGRTAEKGVCFYFGEHRDCTGHFNKDGYALLANFAYEHIQAMQPSGFPKGSPSAAR